MSRRLSVLVVAGIAAVAVACGSSDTVVTPAPAGNGPPGDAAAPVAAAPTQAEAPTPTQQAGPTLAPATQSPPEPSPTTQPADEATAEAATQVPVVPTSTPRPTLNIEDDEERTRAERLRTLWNWDTNLNVRKIPLSELEILLPRDRIVPVDRPTFVDVSNPPGYMDPKEPVVVVNLNGDARAYPLAMLMWHEIVNDTVGGVPLAVTFCPLCNTGIVFERVVDDQELTFGTSGMLRDSNLVMWDRQTESWWQQFGGDAVVGDFAATDTVLKSVASSILSWETFVDAYPDGKLLKRVVNEFGQPARPYDNPPYAGYDSIDDQPFLFSGTIDDRLVATSRVLTVDGDSPVAYPFSFLAENPVLNDSVDGVSFVAMFDDGTLSAFNDASNKEQTSGSATVFSRVVGDVTLTFELTDAGVSDTETGSVWNQAGIAVSGELEGTELDPVIHANHFWFAWAVFRPETQIRDSVDSLTP